MGSRLIQALLVTCVISFVSTAAHATPSTTFWAPSTASCQGRGVPHVTYDTYFRKGPAAGSAGAPNYPIDTGLTAGFLPFNKVQGEVGFDLLLPSPDPLFLNLKLCTPEFAAFKGSPGFSVGVSNVGFKDNVTNYNVVYVMGQKALPVGGYVSAGIYHGFNDTLFTNSDGERVKTGAILGVASPDVQIGLKGFEIGKQLRITRGALTTFSIANDVAKYFAIIPAMFLATFPALGALNLMGLRTPQSAILSAVIFNALIIVALVPLAPRGIHYRPIGAAALLRRNLLIYGIGGVIVPFLGIKAIDVIITAIRLA